MPHEHRRELRALRVFGAWTNLTDLKAGNTLDTIVTENGRRVIKHYLQDVGSTFGMCNDVHEWDLSYEYFYQADTTRRRFFSLGFALSPWQTIRYVEYPSIGKFEGDRFDPRAWRPQTPTTAYMEMRDDDAFWAARRVAAFSGELIRAAVHTGEFSDPAAEQYLGDVLIKRRDTIARTYLTAINPIVDPRLDAIGGLTFGNAAFDAGVATGAPHLSRRLDALRQRHGRDHPARGDAGHDDCGRRASESANGARHASSRWMCRPISQAIRRGGGRFAPGSAASGEGWTLVGLERLPETVSPEPRSRLASGAR